MTGYNSYTTEWTVLNTTVIVCPGTYLDKVEERKPTEPHSGLPLIRMRPNATKLQIVSIYETRGLNTCVWVISIGWNTIEYPTPQYIGNSVYKILAPVPDFLWTITWLSSIYDLYRKYFQSAVWLTNEGNVLDIALSFRYESYTYVS